MDSSNHVRTFDAGSGQKAHLVFSDKTSEVSALLILPDGTSKVVANDNYPKELKMIKTLDTFNTFLENAHARGTVLSDGEAKLYIMQKGLGGSGPYRASPAGGGTANGNWIMNQALALVPPAPMPTALGASVYGSLNAGSQQHSIGAGV